MIALLLLLISGAVAQQCPDLYKRYSSQHTFCLPPNKACSIVRRGVSDADKKLILDLHNEYRNKVATGKEGNAGRLPPAANMLEMVWDDELASVAQKLAETCKYGHDCHNCRKIQSFSVGQNIGKVTGLTSAPERADWNKFIQNLYDEVSRFNKKLIQPFVPGPSGQDKQYGHFTQMVWATSWRVGCGWTVFKDGSTYTSYTTCNYGPSGNMKGGEMYKAGPTCSACPGNTCCGASCKQKGLTQKYSGLCKVVNTVTSPQGPGPHEGKYLFYCDFNNQVDCAMSFDGKPWSIVKTPGGNWLSILLKGGEQTKVTFDKKFPTSEDFCVKIAIRSGPNVDGQKESGKGVSYLDAGRFAADYDLEFEGVPKDLRQDFMDQYYGFNAGKKASIQYKFTYSVPPNAPPQFVEIKEVTVQDGECVLPDY